MPQTPGIPHTRSATARTGLYCGLRWGAASLYCAKGQVGKRKTETFFFFNGVKMEQDHPSSSEVAGSVTISAVT